MGSLTSSFAFVNSITSSHVGSPDRVKSASGMTLGTLEDLRAKVREFESCASSTVEGKDTTSTPGWETRLPFQEWAPGCVLGTRFFCGAS